MNKIILVLILILFISCFDKKEEFSKEEFSNDKKDIKDYIVIGAGPAGLQAGYFLKKYKKKYIILERSKGVGNFFRKYPIHRKLISINKVHTNSKNKDFNLRHDWNSLLSDDNSLLMKNYTKNYFPDASIYVKYLVDYYTKNKLNVTFNTDVKKIDKKDGIFHIKTDTKEYFSKKVIFATGLFKMNNIDIDGIINYSDLTLEKEKFKNKTILIIGQGNSGFEVADHLIDTAAVIHVTGRGALKFAWQTHFPGHLRAVNNNFLDTYQLKSQNGIFDLDLKDTRIKKKNNKYFIYSINDKKEFELNTQMPSNGYDYIINCTGFKMDKSIFGNIRPKHNGKVPLINSKLESINIKNLFFAGTLMQHISYKKSSAPFIHGFRYLIRTLIRMDTNNLKIKLINSNHELLKKILYRINNSSGIYQMFNTLVDVIIFDKQIKYIEELPYEYVKEHYKDKKILVVKLAYGNFGGTIKYTRSLGKASYVFGLDRAIGTEPQLAHLSNFLHPIFELYIKGILSKTHHTSEHIMTEYKLKDTHINPLKKFLATL